jgi:hypothetical protein
LEFQAAEELTLLGTHSAGLLNVPTHAAAVAFSHLGLAPPAPFSVEPFDSLGPQTLARRVWLLGVCAIWHIWHLWLRCRGSAPAPGAEMQKAGRSFDGRGVA